MMDIKEPLATYINQLEKRNQELLEENEKLKRTIKNLEYTIMQLKKQLNTPVVTSGIKLPKYREFPLPKKKVKVSEFRHQI